MGFIIYKRKEDKFEHGQVFCKDLFESMPSHKWQGVPESSSEEVTFVKEVHSDEELKKELKRLNDKALDAVPEERRHLFSV